MKQKVRSLTVELIAEDVLTNLGYKVLDRNHRIKIENVDVAEIDLIAEKNGEKFAVEVKAGTISVTDIRQAYTNALILKYKPLIICRGFSDESARILAEKLDIEVIKLQDYIVFSTPEEVYNLLYSVMIDVLLQITISIYHSFEKEVDTGLLEAVIESKSLSEAAQKAGMSVKDLLNKLEKIGLAKRAEHGIKDFNFIKLQALLVKLASCLR